MNPVVSLFSILLALTLGAISPGPSFLFVTRTSVALSRRDGIAAAIGMGLGAAVISTLALLGVRAVIAQIDWLYIGFKLVGGAYLVYLGWRLWLAADRPAAAVAGPVPRPAKGPGRSFLLALATQFSNPKTVVVIGGIFAALLPNRVPVWMYLAIPPLDLVIEASWYAFVAMAMSSAKPRAAYVRAQKWIDRAAGSLLATLGLRLIFESVRESS
jgi:threonine/homoserine/homoserine lactone efflux protein